MSLRFVIWMLSHPATPTRQQIAAHYGVSRATAYRWLQHWAAAGGPNYSLGRRQAVNHTNRTEDNEPSK